MKPSISFQLYLIFCWLARIDSFNLFGTRTFKNVAAFIRRATESEQETSSTSRPKDGPQPDKPPGLGLHFVKLADDVKVKFTPTEEPPEPRTSDEAKETSSSNAKAIEQTKKSTVVEEPPEPFISDEAKLMAYEMTSKAGEQIMESTSKAGKQIIENVVKPVFQEEVVPSVPGDTIKGAALAGAALTFLVSGGVVASGAAGLSAAYLAISQGVAGDVLRTVGKTTWDVTEATASLCQNATANTEIPEMTKELADKVLSAIEWSQAQAETLKVSMSSSEVSGEVTEAALAESKQELARVLKEAESAMDVADIAIAIADENLGMEDNEVGTVVEDEERLREELRQAEEEVRLEDENLIAQKNEVKETAADEYEEEWEEVIELAQQGLEGKIVGIDEMITDDSAKADWDAAGLLAQELQTGVAEEDDEDGIDSEALGRAAREAVEAFEKEMEANEVAKQEQRDEWNAAVVSETESSSYDMEDLEDLPEGDLEEIARAAREAVALMGEELEDSSDDDEVSYSDFEESAVVSEDVDSQEVSSLSVLQDWSKLTVANLKIELKNRGLKAYGRKAELVAKLEAYEMEQADPEITYDSDSSSDETDFDVDSVDLEELGRQARAAVASSAASIEVGSSGDEKGLEKDNLDTLPSSEGVSTTDGEYEKMTVAQLKDELRGRGLRVSGKKAELIERLRAS